MCDSIFKNIFSIFIVLYSLKSSSSPENNCTKLFKEYEIAPEIRTFNGWSRFLNKELLKYKEDNITKNTKTPVIKILIQHKDIEKLRKCLFIKKNIL